VLKRILDVFEDRILPASRSDDPEAAERGHRLATAALMMEISRADEDVSPEERARVHQLIRDTFELTEAETAELVELAEEEAEGAVSLYQFTTLVNDHFAPEEKESVVELLWRVAYADGVLDPYEEHLIRRIADLIHASHSSFIRAKHRVLEERGD
jgi:uncharacterized tellurite resistance protein B-like protein